MAEGKGVGLAQKYKADEHKAKGSKQKSRK
jgi:hypothetical protein